MNEIIHFFDPFFSTWLFNHSHLSIVTLSVFLSTLLLSLNYKTMTLSVVRQIKRFDTTLMINYVWIVVTIILGFILSYKELSFVESLINILVTFIIFMIISRMIIFLIFPHRLFTISAQESDFVKLNLLFFLVIIIFLIFSTKLGKYIF